MTSVLKIVMSVTPLTRLHFPLMAISSWRAQYAWSLQMISPSKTACRQHRCWGRRYKNPLYKSLFVHVVSDTWTMPVNQDLDQNTSNLYTWAPFLMWFRHWHTQPSSSCLETMVAFTSASRFPDRRSYTEAGFEVEFDVWVEVEFEFEVEIEIGVDFELRLSVTFERELERRMSRAQSDPLASTISKRRQVPTRQPRNSRFHSKQASDPTLHHCSLFPSADIPCPQAAIRRLLNCGFT